MNKQQKYNTLLNNMRKLLYINEKNLSEEQRQEIQNLKFTINNYLEIMKSNQDIDEQDCIQIQNDVEKYSKFINKEYYY